MKRNYFNAVTIDLIEKLNFIPLRDAYGNFTVSEGYITLERRGICSYGIVELIDGDRLSVDQIESHLRGNVEWASQFASLNTCEEPEIIEVFIFSGDPGWDKLQVLYSIPAEQKVLANIVVQLQSQKISVYSQGYFSVDEILLVLSKRLNDNLARFETIPDLHTVVYNQGQEADIEEVSSRSPATYVFIGINVSIWFLGLLIELIYGYNYIILLGIKLPPRIVMGEYWRLVTPMFLHAGVMHLATNSYSLLILGQIVERIFGTSKFIFIYLVSGIVGNIASFTFSDTPSLGASGAVLGVGGALIYVWVKNPRVFSGRRRQYLTLVFLVLFNVFYGFMLPGIDNYAHVGGVISGFLTSGVVRLKNDNAGFGQVLIFAALIIFICVVGVLFGFRRFLDFHNAI